MKKSNLQIAQVRDLGPQFTDNPHQMVGQDGAYSIPLNGETLWFFGDTLFGKRVPGESIWYPGGRPVGPHDMSGRGSIRRMINNCGLLIPADADAQEGLKNYRYILDDEGAVKNLIPLEPGEHPDEVRVWCMHGIALADKIYLFFIKVRMLAEGPLPVNFEILGSGMAVGRAGKWNFRRIRHHGSDLFWQKEDPQFGSAALLSRDEKWVYLYGVKKDHHFTQLSHLARVCPEQIEQREHYQFLISPAPRWGSEVREAMPLFSGPPNEQSVSWNPYLNRYLAVHSLDITGKIVARTAPQPRGPWSEPVEITHITPVREKPLAYPPLVYAAKEHPELSRKNGKIIYITYVEFEEYFPHLLEVELA